MSESTCTAPAIELLGAHPAQVPDGARIDAIEREPACRRRQLLHEHVALGEAGRTGRHRRRQRRGQDHVAGDPRGTAAAVGGRGSARRRHSRCPASAGPAVGYVPQDDIIHLEMPLRRTLRYAARLRLPAGTSAAEADRIVEETMRDLDLADRADVPVRALSGGQRKRASIAVELLTRPRLFFLDEPTSGLDPSTAADVMRLLRRLSRRGVTVVLTTHEPAAIDQCDRVVFLARDGHLAFTGSPAEARRYFGVRGPRRGVRATGVKTLRRSGRTRFADSRREAERPGRLQLQRCLGRTVPASTRGHGPAMVAAHPAQCRCPLSQPADPGDPARLAGAGHGDDGDAVQARRVRSGRRRRHRPGADRVLDRVRRLLLRPDVRPAPDRRRDGGLPAGTAGRAERRRLRGVQGHGAASGAGGSERGAARCAAGARSTARRSGGTCTPCCS